MLRAMREVLAVGCVEASALRIYADQALRGTYACITRRDQLIASNTLVSQCLVNKNENGPSFIRLID